MRVVQNLSLQALERVNGLIKAATYGMAALVGLAIIFKDTSGLKIPVVAGLAILFGSQRLLLSLRQKFYGVSKLPDEE